MNQLLGALGGGASPLPQLGGFGNAGGSPLSNLLAGGLQCSQNEQRLLQEKSQRNILRKYLTQATGDPIQSAFISRTIPGKGYGDTLDVGLGTKNSIMQSLGITQPAQNTGLLSSLIGNRTMPTQNTGLMSTLGGLSGLGGGNTGSTLGTLGALGSLANLGKSQSANTGLLSSLVNLAGTPNNNGNILSTLGGLGSGFGSSGNTGLLGNIQSGINTLNTINKVNNAVSGVQGLFA